MVIKVVRATRMMLHVVTTAVPLSDVPPSDITVQQNKIYVNMYVATCVHDAVKVTLMHYILFGY